MEQPRELDPARLGDHVDRLFRAAWAMCGSREDAEDLVQETYAKVLAKPRFLRNDDDLGYLLSVLRNTFASSYRTAARRPRYRSAARHRRAGRPASARVRRGGRGAGTLTLISDTPTSRRPQQVAVDVVGLSYAEAASLLGTKEATITSRLFRARAQVARGMESNVESVLEAR
jgi:RNA polymerase sigma-70 factor (ECF subfamily)